MSNRAQALYKIILTITNWQLFALMILPAVLNLLWVPIIWIIWMYILGESLYSKVSLTTSLNLKKFKFSIKILACSVLFIPIFYFAGGGTLFRRAK
jgi:hypothetical protein